MGTSRALRRAITTLLLLPTLVACPREEGPGGQGTITAVVESGYDRVILRLRYPDGSFVDFGPLSEVPAACVVGANYPACLAER